MRPAEPCRSIIEVRPSEEWSQRVFRVDAQQPGVGRNATVAVHAAVAAAAANGGGVVFFPSG